MENQIKVSVLMLAYNQEQYIDEAIRSVVLQQTSFPFELIIGNDASKDHTLDRCKAWKEKYPHQIVLLNNTENLGLARNFIHTYEQAKGEYIAICEADDFWTDRRKLQIQADFMDAHKEYSMCFHRVVNFYEADGSKSLSNGGQKQIVNIRDIALCNTITNVAIFYRRGLFGPLPDWMTEVTSYDFVMHMLNAQYGDVYYMKRVMAVYRKLGTSIWTGGGRQKQSMISMKNRDLLIDYFQNRNQEIVDILRLANARNCINLILYLKSQHLEAEIPAFEERIHHYMSEWKESDVERETNAMRLSNKRPPLFKRFLTACRKTFSKVIPLQKIK
jgi:glycosyltransferase involved in cell wall biosynthesis